MCHPASPHPHSEGSRQASELVTRYSPAPSRRWLRPAFFAQPSRNWNWKDPEKLVVKKETHNSLLRRTHSGKLGILEIGKSWRWNLKAIWGQMRWG